MSSGRTFDLESDGAVLQRDSGSLNYLDRYVFLAHFAWRYFCMVCAAAQIISLGLPQLPPLPSAISLSTSLSPSYGHLRSQMQMQMRYPGRVLFFNQQAAAVHPRDEGTLN